MTVSLVNTKIVELHCNASDWLALWQAFTAIVKQLDGVTIINSITHEFPNGGGTGLILLSESHAAIHTWIEHDYIWCELATCGDVADLTRFESLLLELQVNHPPQSLDT